MVKVSMTDLLNRIDQKYVAPAIKQREQAIFNYLQGMDEEALHEYAFNLSHNKGILRLEQPGHLKGYNKPAKWVFMNDLPDYNQAEVRKHLLILEDLRQALGKTKIYLSFLNNKSKTITDIAYALPPHINQLINMVTPDTHLDDDLRDPDAYTLLNKLQIKLLLLS